MKAVRIATIGLITALSSTAVAVAPADAAEPAATRAGTRSLATVLAADGNKFDRTWGDFDVLDRAVRTVLAAKPDSAVAVLADGNTRLTAFLPTDRAFRRLVRDLTGTAPATERAVFTAAATLGVDTIEQVLLFHVVPGRPSRPARCCRPTTSNWTPRRAVTSGSTSAGRGSSCVTTTTTTGTRG